MKCDIKIYARECNKLMVSDIVDLCFADMKGFSSGKVFFPRKLQWEYVFEGKNRSKNKLKACLFLEKM